MSFIQATAVAIDGKGILMTGPSGSGKSDLALRLIQERGASLIGDDGVMITKKDKTIWLSPHRQTEGRLEVRGLGIITVPTLSTAPLVAHIECTVDTIERLPERSDLQKMWQGVSVFSVQINPFHVSSVHKVCVALDVAKNPQRLISDEQGY